ncbi:hypothetical protein [Euzebya tangerina]|uniref:hypothetical protein n=1 Tax=Euzebya tangerina TaxID=591198 RepID=UPI000E31A121|nr:hypothetical protein [Euzebya tangerina]
MSSRSVDERLGRAAADLAGHVSQIRAGVTLDLDTGSRPQAHVVLREAVVDLAMLAGDDGSAVVLHIDEVQNVLDADALSQLLVAIGDALVAVAPAVDSAGNPHERVLPLPVYLTGLRDFTDRATSEAGATFARRFKPLYLTHLDDIEIRAALVPFTTEGWPVLTDAGPLAVTMTAEAVDAIVARALGDPFLFKLLGAAAWSADGGAVITADHVEAGWASSADEVVAHVERAWLRLPPQEQHLFEAIVALPPDQTHALSISGAAGANRIAAWRGRATARGAGSDPTRAALHRRSPTARGVRHGHPPVTTSPSSGRLGMTAIVIERRAYTHDSGDHSAAWCPATAHSAADR